MRPYATVAAQRAIGGSLPSRKDVLRTGRRVEIPSDEYELEQHGDRGDDREHRLQSIEREHGESHDGEHREQSQTLMQTHAEERNVVDEIAPERQFPEGREGKREHRDEEQERGRP